MLRSDAHHWVYRYGVRLGKWTQILPETVISDLKGRSSAAVIEEPQPRYAHQVVYEEGSKTVYMHGGNAGLGNSSDDGMERAIDGEDGIDNDATEHVDVSKQTERRLDDFWSMTLNR